MLIIELGQQLSYWWVSCRGLIGRTNKAWFYWTNRLFVSHKFGIHWSIRLCCISYVKQNFPGIPNFKHSRLFWHFEVRLYLFLLRCLGLWIYIYILLSQQYWQFFQIRNMRVLLRNDYAISPVFSSAKIRLIERMIFWEFAANSQNTSQYIIKVIRQKIQRDIQRKFRMARSSSQSDESAAELSVKLDNYKNAVERNIENFSNNIFECTKAYR